jgi:hypothetical protein
VTQGRPSASGDFTTTGRTANDIAVHIQVHPDDDANATVAGVQVMVLDEQAKIVES